MNEKSYLVSSKSSDCLVCLASILRVGPGPSLRHHLPVPSCSSTPGVFFPSHSHIEHPSGEALKIPGFLRGDYKLWLVRDSNCRRWCCPLFLEAGGEISLQTMSAIKDLSRRRIMLDRRFASFFEAIRACATWYCQASCLWPFLIGLMVLASVMEHTFAEIAQSFQGSQDE